jgi:hypothetical protein
VHIADVEREGICDDHIFHGAVVRDPVTGGTQKVPHVALATGSTTQNQLVAGSGGQFLAARVVDLATGSVQWGVRAWHLSHFSPSGRYVIGTQQVGVQQEPEVGDVIGVFEAATGKLVMRVVLPQTTIESVPGWERNDAVVLVGQDRAG